MLVFTAKKTGSKATLDRPDGLLVAHRGGQLRGEG